MKKKILFLMILFTGTFLFQSQCLAKLSLKSKQKTVTLPFCTAVGEMSCPKGLKPKCPQQYKPLCVFVGGKQLPSCLADSPDNTAFSYNLENISCQ